MASFCWLNCVFLSWKSEQFKGCTMSCAMRQSLPLKGYLEIARPLDQYGKNLRVFSFFAVRLDHLLLRKTKQMPFRDDSRTTWLAVHPITQTKPGSWALVYPLSPQFSMAHFGQEWWPGWYFAIGPGVIHFLLVVWNMFHFSTKTVWNFMNNPNISQQFQISYFQGGHGWPRYVYHPPVPRWIQLPILELDGKDRGKLLEALRGWGAVHRAPGWDKANVRPGILGAESWQIWGHLDVFFKANLDESSESSGRCWRLKLLGSLFDDVLMFVDVGWLFLSAVHCAPLGLLEHVARRVSAWARRSLFQLVLWPKL